jgi:thioredoxin-like negative regulator of GroEL
LALLASDLEGELRLAAVNLDHSAELAGVYHIARVPALILFNTGAPIARLDVSMSPRQMRAQLQGLLADHATHCGP